jgi:hypothetical protein
MLTNAESRLVQIHSFSQHQFSAARESEFSGVELYSLLVAGMCTCVSAPQPISKIISKGRFFETV